MSTLLQAKQLIWSTTSMFFIGWEMRYNQNGCSYGQLLTGSFITTCPLMHHVSRRVFLVKPQITHVTQTPYSPDLAPYDFWLFPKLKSPLEGKRFQTTDESQENTTEQLMVIPRRILQNVLNGGRDTGRTVWGLKVPTLNRTEVSLSYVQCILYHLQQMSLT